jgi:non-homologous end joining protein Ku
MAPRSNWKGYLNLSLVSAPIAIDPATSFGEKVRINTFNRATGNRPERHMVDSVTSDMVENEDIAHSFERLSEQRHIVVGLERRPISVA